MSNLVNSVCPPSHQRTTSLRDGPVTDTKAQGRSWQEALEIRGCVLDMFILFYAFDVAI